MDVNRIRTLNTSTNEFKDMKFDSNFVEQLVYEWIRRMKAYSDFTLSNSIIQSMAIQFKLVLNMTSFFPNTEWINRFRVAYMLNPASTTKLHIGYREKKSVQVRDIIRELLRTGAGKPKEAAQAEIKVQHEPVDECEVPDVEIIEIGDEIKHEYEVLDFDVPCPDTPSVAIEETIPTINQITEEVTKYGEVVDFENELPSSVVLNYTTQKEAEEVLDDVLNRDDVEDFIPALVCSPKVLKFEQPKPKKTRASASTRATRVKVINPPDAIPAKRMRNAASNTSPIQVIAADEEALSLLVPMSEPINLELSQTLEPKNKETAVVMIPAPVPSKTYSIPSTVTIKKISQSTEIPRKPTRFLNRQPLKTREEALKCIKLMEEFALLKENFRLIGFIERLEKLIRNEN